MCEAVVCGEIRKLTTCVRLQLQIVPFEIEGESNLLFVVSANCDAHTICLCRRLEHGSECGPTSSTVGKYGPFVMLKVEYVALICWNCDESWHRLLTTNKLAAVGNNKR